MTSDRRPWSTKAQDSKIYAEASGSAQVNIANRDITILNALTVPSDADVADLVPNDALVKLEPHALGVRRATMPAGSRSVQSSGTLTPYLVRSHDLQLRRAIDTAASGASSVLAFLVGDSATGKTRALYEALNDNALLRTWPMLRPANATEILALLNEHRIVCGTILWLNETQKYLYGSESERAAYGLIRLLESTERIVIVGAMWHDYLTQLATAGEPGDPARAATRELLDGPYAQRFYVPNRLSADQQRAMAALPGSDARLATALAASGREGEVIQHLTGGPELLDAYIDGGLFGPVEHALITAALEARRLGHNASLPQPLLAAAADGYLAASQRPGRDDWASMALTDITVGVRAKDGTRTDVRKTLTALAAHRSHAGQAEPSYEPNGFLDQNTREMHAAQVGTPHLWDALAVHTVSADDLFRLGRAAHRRGLYRHAAQMWFRSTALGHAPAAAPLIRAIARSDVTALHEAAYWVVQHVTFDNPRAMRALICALRNTGESELSISLARRAAEYVDLNNTPDVAELVNLFQQMNIDEAVNDLAARAAEQAPVESARHVTQLLKALITSKANTAAKRLALRVAEYPFAGTSARINSLLHLFWQAREYEALTVLALQASRRVTLEHPRATGSLIRAVSRAGADEALAELLSRDPAGHVSLVNLSGVSSLIGTLHKLSQDQSANRLAARAADEVTVRSSRGMPQLIGSMESIGSHAAVATLVDRIIASLSSIEGASAMFAAMQANGVPDRIAGIGIIAARDCDVSGVSYIAKALDGQECDNVLRELYMWAARNAILVNAQEVAALIRFFYRAGVYDAVNVLGERAANNIAVDDVRRVSTLISTLSRVDVRSTSLHLAARAARDVSLDKNVRDIARIFTVLRKVRARRGVATLMARKLRGRRLYVREVG